MNVFDIMGPVMIGPSSSHTAGAVRIGRIARTLLGEKPLHVLIKLHGSFARTYKGHGTDKAIIGGLLEFEVDDTRLRDSINLAEKAGMEFSIKTENLGDVHPNTALIEACGKSGKKISLLGSSIGGGDIEIKQVNGVACEFTGKYNTLIVPHRDEPGIVAAVTNILAFNNINIAYMKVYRDYKGGDAIMVTETDQAVSDAAENMINSIPGVKNATVVKPI